MLGFVLYDPADPEGHRTLEVGHTMQLPEAPEDSVWVEVPLPACEWGATLENGEVIVIPRPVPLALARHRRWEEAKALYHLRLSSGFEIHDIGRVQTDPESREAIKSLYDKATMMIAAGLPWSTSFKNQANVLVPVTAEQIVGIYAAVLDFGGACFTAKEAVGEALAGAMTVDQIAAIDITAGYPA